MPEHEELEIEREEGLDEGCSPGHDEVIHDEDGALTLGRALPELTPRIADGRFVPSRPCSLRTLDGSWLLHLEPDSPHIFSQIRGPMRIEAKSSRIRISGDVYVKSLFRRAVGGFLPVVREPFIPGSLVIRRNWYPAFPQAQYRWYFRSLGVVYSGGVLTFRFARHLWSTTQEEFVSSDVGWMRLTCKRDLIHAVGAPQPTVQMKGKAMIGGRSYSVTATKTSIFYRGCLVEVDVMKNRSWPATASSCSGSQSFSFTGVYRSAGLDFRVVVNETDIPEDNLLTTAELHHLLATHRSLSPGGENWRLWLLAGSRMDGTLGIMFDTNNPPHREGAVGFYDPKLPNLSIIQASARGKKLGQVPLAFLRTFIHEAGHAFNLFHPKHDTHGIAKGTTIMNQTGDVMGFATAANPYPCNATFAFNGHNRTSLIHSPDPQVKPSWKPFGWGHGSLSSGVPEPVDATGLDVGSASADGLELKVTLPPQIHRGEVVLARLEVVNRGDCPRRVSTALNLAEGDLRARIKTPAGSLLEPRDVVVVCSHRRQVELQPGQSFTGSIQLHYTNEGFPFDQPGRYTVEMELETGDEEDSVVRSGGVEVLVRSAASDKEAKLEDLTFHPGLGLSLALGDFGGDKEAHGKLKETAESYSDSATGAACAMVLANSLARDFRDLYADKVVRSADAAAAEEALDKAFAGRDAAETAELATAVVSPREVDAPLLDQLRTRWKKARKGMYTKKDLDLADQILSDHLG